MRNSTGTDEVLTGVGLVPGRAKGRVFVFATPSRIEEDFLGVLDRIAGDLEREKEDVFAQFVRLIITDPTFRKRLKTCLDLGVSEKEAVDIALRPLVERMRSADPFFARKAQEIVQIIHDILHNGTLDLPINEDTVFVAESVSIPLALKLKTRKVAAVVLKELSSDSHAAIILANAHIPTVVGIDPTKFRNGEVVYVDGEAGIVSRKPIDTFDRQEHIRKGRIFLTADGEEVEILLNLDIPEDVFWAERYETGVGLLRTEYLLNVDLGRVDWERFARLNAPVIIRAYDVGGEKYHGTRGAMRLLNDLREKFDSLLEIVKRYPNFRIMIPMVDFPDTARTFYDYVTSKGIEHLGFMVEVPSFAWSISGVNDYATFFSVGTNDLWAFFTGRERGTSDIKEQVNPVFGDLLRHVLNNSRRPVSVCGQLASDEDGLRFLLSLGFRRFSVSPSFFVKAAKIVEDWRKDG